MSDLPRYDGDDDMPAAAGSAPSKRWLRTLAWLVPIALVATIIGLHLAGVVGPGR